MGRAKSNMEFIKKEKLRSNAFQHKTNHLKKKVYELTTLCDIKAAMIVYGPMKSTPQAPVEPEIWPQNRGEVLELINKYKGQSPEDRKNRTTLMPDFFKERIQNAQKALTKQRKDNVQSKYPTWYSRFDRLKEDDLRKSVVYLDNVIGSAKAKLERMRANNICHAYEVQQQQQQQQLQLQQQHMMLSKKRKMNSDEGNQASKYLKIEPYQTISDPVQVPIPMPFPIHQQQRPPFVDLNCNQMMIKFGNEYAGGPSNFAHNAPMPNAVHNCPSVAETLNSIRYVDNLARAPSNYYGEGRQPIAQHVAEFRPMTKESNSHQMVLHPMTQGSNSHQMEFRPMTKESNSHQMVLHPMTQGSNSHQMEFQPMTKEFNSHQMVLHPMTQGSNSHQMVLHPMTQGSDSHQMVLHPMTQGSNSHQMASDQYFEDCKWPR